MASGRSERVDCGCRKCGTWAEITRYDCGCVRVEIYNDRNPCAECTDFSGKRRRCGQSGHPDGHSAKRW